MSPSNNNLTPDDHDKTPSPNSKGIRKISLSASNFPRSSHVPATVQPIGSPRCAVKISSQVDNNNPTSNNSPEPITRNEDDDRVKRSTSSLTNTKPVYSRQVTRPSPNISPVTNTSPPVIKKSPEPQNVTPPTIGDSYDNDSKRKSSFHHSSKKTSPSEWRKIETKPSNPVPPGNDDSSKIGKEPMKEVQPTPKSGDSTTNPDSKKTVKSEMNTVHLPSESSSKLEPAQNSFKSPPGLEEIQNRQTTYTLQNSSNNTILSIEDLLNNKFTDLLLDSSCENVPDYFSSSLWTTIAQLPLFNSNHTSYSRFAFARDEIERSNNSFDGVIDSPSANTNSLEDHDLSQFSMFPCYPVNLSQPYSNHESIHYDYPYSSDLYRYPSNTQSQMLTQKNYSNPVQQIPTLHMNQFSNPQPMLRNTHNNDKFIPQHLHWGNIPQQSYIDHTIWRNPVQDAYIETSGSYMNSNTNSPTTQYHRETSHDHNLYWTHTGVSNSLRSNTLIS